ncbi:MAG: efflux RND transporter periplasmic adaptor subunit [Acidobacteriota bacterium]
MTETTSRSTTEPTAEVRGSTPWAAFSAVAAAALLIGAGGTVALLRYGPSAGQTIVHRTAGPVAADPATPDAPPADGTAPEGAIYISPARQQIIGVRTAAIAARDLSDEVKTVGTLAYDETRVTRVHTKITGWIDQLFVDFVGKPVEKGQALFTIYSPDLVSTQQEYLLARKAAAQLGNSRFEETRQSAASMLAAARTRLMLWDVSAEEMATLERTGEPSHTLTVFAPSSGIVLERNAFAGHYITPDMNIFNLVDLSRIWAIGQLTEGDLARVRIGQRATVELTNVPGARALTGTVTFIYPDVDPTTRRGRVRVEVPNRDLSLRADAFVTVTIHTASERTLAVPTEAVIDTGTRQYVILARGNGYFEPRSIETGAAAGGFVTVHRGLAAGDRVVTSAQFLIDSETNLQAAMQVMSDPLASSPVGAASEPPAPTASAATIATGQETRKAAVIALETSPSAIHVGDNAIDVAVTGADGKPIVDASVAVTFFMAGMPAMGMPDMRLTSTLESRSNGRYQGTANVPVAGTWTVSITATRAGQRLGIRRLTLTLQ